MGCERCHWNGFSSKRMRQGSRPASRAATSARASSWTQQSRVPRNWGRILMRWSSGWPSDMKPGRLDPALIDLCVGRGADVGTAIATLRRMTDTAIASSGPRLEDLYGYGPAKEWGLRLVQSLEDYRSGLLPWSEVDGGALLVGPPGTGKTLFASALARSANVAFSPRRMLRGRAPVRGIWASSLGKCAVSSRRLPRRRRR